MTKDQHHQVFCALDSGSQSTRAILFDVEGTILGRGSRVHAPMQHPEPGAVEQDPEDLRRCLFEAISDCLRDWGGPKEHIKGAALTSQRSSVLLLDHAGEPLTQVWSWLDRRVASLSTEPSLLMRKGLSLLGSKRLIPRLLERSWPRIFREHCPDELARAAKIATVEAWLCRELTGRIAMAHSGVVGPWPFDVKALCWSKSHILKKALGYQTQWLADLEPPGTRLGQITPAVAKATGLPTGLPLFACGGDKQAEAVGGGVLACDGERASVSLGTAASICIPHSRAITSPTYRWLTLSAAEPNAWCHEYMVFRGMWTARWFAENFARDLAPAAAQRGLPVEALLCEEAAQIPPGSEGVTVTPRWSPSLQDPTETGIIAGLREGSQRGHVFRALLEGIAADLSAGLQLMESALNVKIRELVVGGGGARSALPVEVLARVTELPVRAPSCTELSCRGAAIIAAVGCGAYPDIAVAARAMTSDSSVISIR